MSRITACVGIVFLLAAATSQASNITVGNAGFETVVPIPYFPVTNYGIWTGNPATIVATENGVVPLEGSHMLKFTGGDQYSNVWQMIDVSSLPAGSEITLSAAFNQATGSSANFQMRIAALNHGPPSNGNPEFDQTTIATLNPAIPINSWTTVSLSAILPPNTVTIGIEVAGQFGDLAYADNVQVTPEPSSIALAAVALVGLIALGRRKRA